MKEKREREDSESEDNEREESYNSSNKRIEELSNWRSNLFVFYYILFIKKN
jgi:hypothetical protein